MMKMETPIALLATGCLVLSTAVCLAGGEAAADADAPLVVNVRLLDPDGTVVAPAEIPASVEAFGNINFFTKGRAGSHQVTDARGGIPVDFVAPAGDGQNAWKVYRGPIPWARRAREQNDNLGSGELSVSVLARVEGGNEFPYVGQGAVHDVEPGGSYDLDVQLELNERWLPKTPGEVPFRLVSAATGEPLAGWRIRVGGEEVVLDEQGTATVTVANVERPVRVGVSHISGWSHYPEVFQRSVAPETMARAIETGEAIELRSDEPELVIRTTIVDASGKRSPFDGRAVLHLLREGHENQRLLVRRGYAVAPGFHAAHRRAGASPEDLTPLAAGEEVGFRLGTGFAEGLHPSVDRITIPAGDPPTVDLVLEASGPRALTLRVRDAAGETAVATARVAARRGREVVARGAADGDGTIALAGLPWREVRLDVQAEGYESRRLTNVPGDGSDLEVALTPLVPVAVTVRPPEGVAAVAILQPGPERGLSRQVAMPPDEDGAGVVRFAGVPARAGVLGIIDEAARAVAVRAIDPRREEERSCTVAAARDPVSVALRVTGGPAEAVRAVLLDARTGLPLHKDPVVAGGGDAAIHRLGRPVLPCIEVPRRGWARLPRVDALPADGPLELAVDLGVEREWSDDLEAIIRDLLTADPDAR